MIACQAAAGQGLRTTTATAPGTAPVRPILLMGVQQSHTQTTCSAPDYVNYNPSAFQDAYWDFAAVRIYQPSNSTSGTSSLAESAGGGAALFSIAVALVAGLGSWIL